MTTNLDALRDLLDRAAPDLPGIDFDTIAGSTPRLSTRNRAVNRSTWTVALATIVVVGIAVLAVALRAQAPASHVESPPAPAIQAGVSASTLATYVWRTLPVAPIATRSSAAAVWTGREMIVWGGAHSNTLEADGAAYDPMSRTWRKLPQGPLSARLGSAATWVRGNMVIFGGIDSATKPFEDGARYIPATNSWSMIPAPPSVPGHPYAAQLVTVGSLAMLIRIDQQPTGLTAYVDGYNPTTNSWRDLPDYHSPAGHEIQQIVALSAGNTVYLWSDWLHTVPFGHNSFGSIAGTDTVRLDVTDDPKWAPSPVVAPYPGESPKGAAWTGTSILLPQAQTYGVPNGGPPPAPTARITSLLLNPSTGHGFAIPVGPASMPNARLIWTGDAVLALGISGTADGTQVAAAWNAKTNTWTTVATPPSIGYAETGSIWTGTELILFGYADSNTSTPGVEFGPR